MTSVRAVRPHVTVKLHAAGCAYELRVNDVPVVADRDGLPLRVEWPVNHLVRAGANELALRVEPCPGRKDLDGAVCCANVRLRTSGAHPEEAVDVATLGYSPAVAPVGVGESASSLAGAYRLDGGDDDGDALVASRVEAAPTSNGGYWLRRTLAWPIDLPAWAFFSADPIGDGEVAAGEARAVVQSAWDALASGDGPAASAMFQERTRELARAFHRTESEMERVLGLEAALRDPDLALQPLDPEPVFEIFGNGRLARLSRWDGTPQIAFSYSDGSATRYYDMIFRRQSGRLVITR